MKVWTPEQARQFLAFTREDRLHSAWALLLALGLRRGELCGLRWSAIDLDGAALHVDPTLILADGRTAESRPKTEAGRRRVHLTPQLVGLLRKHRTRQLEERMQAGGAVTKTAAT